jgi:hypothetical protein
MGRLGLSQHEVDDVIGRESNGNGSLSVKQIIGAAITALVLGFGSYLVGGASKADDVKSQLEVFKVEVSGQLALIRADQARVQQDLASIKEAVKAK